MNLVDTHCHIQSIGQTKGEETTKRLWEKSGFSSSEVLARAKESGVNKLICVGCDLEDSKLSLEFTKDKPNCFSSIGIHPHEAKLYAKNEAKLKEFEDLADESIVAIGECGLDYYYEHSPKEDQIKLVKFQIELALKDDLPLIFHVREAFSDFWPIFDSYEGIKGVLHSFTDSMDNLKLALSRGLFIGVNGIATFTKDPHQAEVYKAIPLKRLLLETDAPFLTPTPYRGNINEPMRVGNVAEYLADLRGESIQTLANTTTLNAKELFGI